MKNGKLQVGIIGCGGIANQKHLPALKNQSHRVDMVAFCDTIIERAEKAAKEYGVEGAKTYTDYMELLADPEIDLVHVLTPNVAHSPITCAAFEAGKHVMCEKPMAHNTEAAQKMLDAWKASGKKFTIGYQNRYRQDTQLLHKACEAGEFGDIYFAKSHAIRRRGVPTWGVFPNKALQGGGPLIDIGTHALDITLWCMNNYKPVSVMGSVFEKLGHSELAAQGNMFGPWDTKTYEVEDSAFGYIKFENGATVFLESAWAINMKDSREAACTLCGTKGGAEIVGEMAGGNATGREYDLVVNGTYHGELVDQKLANTGTIAFFTGESSEPKNIECKQWLDAIFNDTDPCVLPEQAFVVTQILEAIYKSAQTGAEVKLN